MSKTTNKFSPEVRERAEVYTVRGRVSCPHSCYIQWE